MNSFTPFSITVRDAYDGLYTVTRSKSGILCIGVGGGSSTNTSRGQWVMSDGRLKKSIFIKSTGSLCNAFDQAIVPLAPGDIICRATGNLPVEIENPDMEFVALLVTHIEHDETGIATGIKVREIEFNVWMLVESVVAGMTTYHNKDGRFFCTPPTNSQQNEQNAAGGRKGGLLSKLFTRED